MPFPIYWSGRAGGLAGGEEPTSGWRRVEQTAMEASGKSGTRIKLLEVQLKLSERT